MFVANAVEVLQRDNCSNDDKYQGIFHKFDVHPVLNRYFMQHCSEMHDQFVAGTKAEKGDIISDVIEHFSSKGGW